MDQENHEDIEEISVSTEDEPITENELVSVDVGYGYVKALTSLAPSKRLSFPSVMAPDITNNNSLDRFFNSSVGYKVRIRGALNGTYLVGERARYSSLMTKVVGPDKPMDIHDILLLTAIYLVSASTDPVVDLVVGLPLFSFQTHGQELAEHLANVNAVVSVDDGLDREISFDRIEVLPQGVGVIFSEGLPEGSGLVGVVDVGEYTTDYLLADLLTTEPIVEGCGSVPRGMYLVKEYLSQAYHNATGESLNTQWEERLLRNKGRISYRGSEIDLSKQYNEAKRLVSENIAREVLNAWGDFAKGISMTYIAGGGAVALGEMLSRHFPAPLVVHDPVFANARGYLVFAQNDK